MSDAELYLVLGARPGAGEAALRAAHRRSAQLVDPELLAQAPPEVRELARARRAELDSALEALLGALVKDPAPPPAEPAPSGSGPSFPVEGGTAVAWPATPTPEEARPRLAAWAARSRFVDGGVFDGPLELSDATMARVTMRRLIETRAEEEVRRPGVQRPSSLYAGELADVVLPPPEGFAEERFELAREGSVLVMACDRCESGYNLCKVCAGMGRLPCEPMERCGVCSGSGRRGEGPCPGCGGRGQRVCATCGGSSQKTCLSCLGRGRHKCRTCKGSGQVTEFLCGTIIRTPSVERRQTDPPEGLRVPKEKVPSPGVGIGLPPKGKGREIWTATWQGEGRSVPSGMSPEASRLAEELVAPRPPGELLRRLEVETLAVSRVTFERDGEQVTAFLVGADGEVQAKGLRRPPRIGRRAWLVAAAAVLVLCAALGAAWATGWVGGSPEETAQASTPSDPPGRETASREPAAAEEEPDFERPPSGESTGPNVSSLFANHDYTLSCPTAGQPPTELIDITLVDGRWTDAPPGRGVTGVVVESRDVALDADEEAIVSVGCAIGANNVFLNVLVYDMSEPGSPEQLGQTIVVERGEVVREPGVPPDVLTVRSPSYESLDSTCCPSSEQFDRYTLSDGRWELVDSQRKPVSAGENAPAPESTPVAAGVIGAGDARPQGLPEIDVGQPESALIAAWGPGRGNGEIPVLSYPELGLDVTVDRGVVRVITIYSGGWRTPSGAGVGATVAEVEAIYPDTLESVPYENSHFDSERQYFVRAGGGAIGFVVSEGEVIWMIASGADRIEETMRFIGA